MKKPQQLVNKKERNTSHIETDQNGLITCVDCKAKLNSKEGGIFPFRKQSPHDCRSCGNLSWNQDVADVIERSLKMTNFLKTHPRIFGIKRKFMPYFSNRV